MDPNKYQTFIEAPLKRQETQVTTTHPVRVELVGEVHNLRQDGQKFPQQQQHSPMMDNSLRKAG